LLKPIFGEQFEVQKHLEKVIIIVVLLSISPAIYAGIRAWMGRKKKSVVSPEPLNQNEVPQV
jgi:membrane-associated protein